MGDCGGKAIQNFLKQQQIEFQEMKIKPLK